MILCNCWSLRQQYMFFDMCDVALIVNLSIYCLLSAAIHTTHLYNRVVQPEILWFKSLGWRFAQV
uniref:Uncharacterized protein n=1 Tax=Arundo donax TaxID=35708 RepID=A0A0A9G6Y7_ARUDO